MDYDGLPIKRGRPLELGHFSSIVLSRLVPISRPSLTGFETSPSPDTVPRAKGRGNRSAVFNELRPGQPAGAGISHKAVNGGFRD